MNRDFECIEPNGIRAIGRKDMYVAWISQGAGHFVLCVMISGDQIDRDVALSQTSHLADEELAGSVVFPVAIEDVPCDQEE
jgi:hypothetical protein